jgi:O-acetyl-ADP-ribose deacetylase (regulator of RNase III)
VIRVVVGDLARQTVDAVLRPADAALQPVGPAATGLDQAGGTRFADQRRTATPLEAGAAVVTGGGDLPAGFVLHVVIADERGPAGPEKIRRALISAWQRAGDWGLPRVATPLIGSGSGALTPDDSARLLVETYPNDLNAGAELLIVVGAEEQDLVEAIVGRTQA